MPCPIAQFAEILGDKWSLLILRDALMGVNKFSDFARRSGIAKNILTERLARLVQHGILIRQPVRPGVERYTYELSDKGKELFPVAVAITQWSDKWVYGPGKEPTLIVDKESQQPVKTICVQAQDGRVLNLEDICYVSRARSGLDMKDK